MEPVTQCIILGVLDDLGPLDAEGIRPVIGTLTGWHVNVPEAYMTPALEPYRIATPANPRDIFAGVPEQTAFLRFASEAEAQSVGIGLSVED